MCGGFRRIRLLSWNPRRAELRLDEGLPEADAVALLRALDIDYLRRIKCW
jgi:hypothetical protein